MFATKTYLICGTPRSGSSLLCEALTNTGVAGRPAEFFWRGGEPAWAAAWGVPADDFAIYLRAALLHGTTPNGVFGAKMMWGYLEDFVAQARQIPAYAPLGLPDLLSTVFPNLQYIWLSRRDKVRQAISHWRALQTGTWGQTSDSRSPSTAEPRYDRAAIDHLVREVVAHDAAWSSYFAENRVEPLRIEYETFVSRYEATILEVLDFLSVPVPADLGTSRRRMRRQADTLTEEWVRRHHDAQP